ncbi:hypothetical protein LGQ02_15700 [Bacillus shivajii]|uniref:hypothetical protein n=1 Tax=Bacillus shivajii TaxID=1983719 RepID=UPI001CFC0697|nr:hypothetical protein [Bacillus shivajii]UCZ52275.1 hypothetical protein LGQ02_15700 [Bacillus shivajii]
MMANRKNPQQNYYDDEKGENFVHDQLISSYYQHSQKVDDEKLQSQQGQSTEMNDRQ